MKIVVSRGTMMSDPASARSQSAQPDRRVRQGQFQKEKFYSLPKTNQTINKDKINQWFQKEAGSEIGFTFSK